MAKGKETVKAIQEAITRLEAERARIDGRIEGLREAMRIQSSTPLPAEPEVRRRARRGDLNKTVLEMATKMGAVGLTADECVDLARKENGTTLNRSSVSSLLSRLKQDSILFFDGERYRLAKFRGPRQAA